MLDFSAVRDSTQSIPDLSQSLNKTDLQTLTDQMIDTQLAILADATDADVVFVPVDPEANDTFGTDDVRNLAWTLGHVIVHVTASSEEAAAIASALARGVAVEGRSRYETPWETVHTVAQLRARLEESRRIRQASLQMWPDAPHLENTQNLGRYGAQNAVARFVMGLSHDDAHLEQLREIMRQARAARTTVH